MAVLTDSRLYWEVVTAAFREKIVEYLLGPSAYLIRTQFLIVENRWDKVAQAEIGEQEYGNRCQYGHYRGVTEEVFPELAQLPRDEQSNSTSNPDDEKPDPYWIETSHGTPRFFEGLKYWGHKQKSDIQRQNSCSVLTSHR